MYNSSFTILLVLLAHFFSEPICNNCWSYHFLLSLAHDFLIILLTQLQLHDPSLESLLCTCHLSCACPSFHSGYFVVKLPSLVKSNLCLLWALTCAIDVAGEKHASLSHLCLTSWPLNHKQTHEATGKSYLSSSFILSLTWLVISLPSPLCWEPEVSLIVPLNLSPCFIFHQNRSNQKRTSQILPLSSTHVLICAHMLDRSLLLLRSKCHTLS